MRQKVHVGQQIAGLMLKLLEAQVEDLESDIFILGAIVLHKRGRNVHLARAARVMARFFEHQPGRLDPLSPPGEAHVLDVAERRIDLGLLQILVVDVVHLFVLDPALLVVGIGEVEQAVVRQWTVDGAFVDHRNFLGQILRRRHVLYTERERALTLGLIVKNSK